jgi:signal transduction histidine kinase/CheY-like chemotaxis protein
MKQVRLVLLGGTERVESMRAALGSGPYRIVGHGRLLDAAHVAETGCPDLILADLAGESTIAELVEGVEALARRHKAQVVYLADSVDVPAVGARVGTDGDNGVKPLACLLHPVSSELLTAAVEVGLYRGRVERRLQETQRAAEAADRAKTSFLSTISHELRTPMNGVLGMTELLLLSDLDDPYRENVQLIKESSLSLLSVLNQIIDYSKLEASVLTIREADFRLEDLITGVLSQYGRTAASKGVAVSYEIASDVPGWMRGDSGKIRQVLGNLVNNAVKFTRAGEVRVQVVRQPEPTEGADEDGLMVQVRVSDTGIGIPAAKLDDIFECFSQAEDHLSHASGALGLGLAIVSRLLAILGGSIHCSSEEGDGSVFCFTVPLKRSRYEKRSPLAEVMAEGMPLEGVRVLVAEDDLLSQRYMLGILEKMGCVVSLASDGDQAVEALRRRKYDIVLMDVEMPVQSGTEATMAIRRPETGCLDPEVPVVALTAHAMWGDEQRCMHAGMDHYVSKPVDIDTVAAIIQSTLKK